MKQSKEEDDLKRHLPFLILYLGYAVFLFYLFFLWESYPNATGGSLAFMTILAFGHFYALKYRELSLPISLLSVAVFSLVALNFLLFLIVSMGLSLNLLAAPFVALIIMSQCFYHASIRHFMSKSAKFEPLQNDLMRRVRLLIFSGTHVSILFIYVAAIMFMASMEYEPLKDLSYKFSNIFILSLLIGPTFLLSTKRRHLNFAIEKLTTLKIVSADNLSIIKKRFFSLAFIMLLLGSGLELMRGLWIIWIGSWLALCLIMINIYRTWKYIFIKTSDASNLTAMDDVMRALPLPGEASTFFKTFVILTSALTIYGIIIAAIILAG